MELNPNHPVTRLAAGEWHKIAALIMHKLGKTEIVITPADIQSLPLSGHANITIQVDRPDGIHVRLVDDETARRLVREHGGAPSQS